MIKYTITCTHPCKSTFEGQFPNVKSFNKQRKMKMIICPLCDGLNLTYAKVKTKGQNADQAGRR